MSSSRPQGVSNSLSFSTSTSINNFSDADMATSAVGQQSTEVGEKLWADLRMQSLVEK